MRPAVVTTLSALAAGIVVLAIGITGVWAGVPWLFASIGPTVSIQIATPHHQSAQPRNIAIGHALAILAALVGITLTGTIHAAPFATGSPLLFARASAAAIAVALGLGLELAFDATHPPAAATAMLVALGFVPASAHGIGVLFAGIALVIVFGEIARRLRMRLVATMT